MRIGIDCRLPTYRMGGISQYVLHLMPALAALDSQHQYVALHSRKEAGSYLPPLAQNWSRRDLWTPCHHRFERWTLAAELAPLRLDVLHSPDFIPPAGGASRKVITIHDLNFKYYPELLTPESRRYYQDQIEWAVAEADAIAADSHATRRDVIELLGVSPEKVTAIHLAANPIYRQPVARPAVQETLRQFGLTRGYLLFVGTLEPRKNLPMLLQVYARLRQEKHVEAPLVLVGGKGWLFEDVFATIERLGLESVVKHLSGVPDAQLAHLYHEAGALLTPSLYEGFGLPALEAQHCGCPAVVSDRGSFPEIVGEKGLTIDPGDSDRWVEVVAHLLSDKEFRVVTIDNGYEQAKRFSWSDTASKTLALYLGSGVEAG